MTYRPTPKIGLPYTSVPSNWRSERLFIILDTQFNAFLNYSNMRTFMFVYHTILTILATNGKYLPVEITEDIKRTLEDAKTICQDADNPNIPGKAYSQREWMGIEAWRNVKRNEVRDKIYAVVHRLNMIASDTGMRGGY